MTTTADVRQKNDRRMTETRSFGKWALGHGYRKSFTYVGILSAKGFTEDH
jgi:hypothetical protein